MFRLACVLPWGFRTHRHAAESERPVPNERVATAKPVAVRVQSRSEMSKLQSPAVRERENPSGSPAHREVCPIGRGPTRQLLALRFANQTAHEFCRQLCILVGKLETDRLSIDHGKWVT